MSRARNQTFFLYMSRYNKVGYWYTEIMKQKVIFIGRILLVLLARSVRGTEGEEFIYVHTHVHPFFFHFIFQPSFKPAKKPTPNPPIAPFVVCGVKIVTTSFILASARDGSNASPAASVLIRSLISFSTCSQCIVT